MFGRTVLCGAGVVLTVAACGCGGGSPATEPDPRADRQRWIHAVDTVCAQTEQRIAARGRPGSLAALPDLIVGATADVRHGAHAIEAVRPPSRMSRPVSSFRKSIGRLGPLLAQLERTAHADELDPLEEAKDDLEVELWVLHSSARDAGLARCADPDGTRVAMGALDAVFLAADVGALDSGVRRRVSRLRKRLHPATVAQAIAFYDRLGDILNGWLKDFTSISVPERLQAPAGRYRYAILDLQTLCGKVAAELEQRAVITPAYADSVDRRFAGAEARVRRVYGRLRRAIASAAEPVTPAPPGGTTPDEPAQT